MVAENTPLVPSPWARLRHCLAKKFCACQALSDAFSYAELAEFVRSRLDRTSSRSCVSISPPSMMHTRAFAQREVGFPTWSLKPTMRGRAIRRRSHEFGITVCVRVDAESIVQVESLYRRGLLHGGRPGSGRRTICGIGSASGSELGRRRLAAVVADFVLSEVLSAPSPAPGRLP